MLPGESNVDRLLRARSEIDEELRRHKDQLTLVFTDVVGSTSYFDRFGDTAGFVMLRRHAELATNTFMEYQGTVIKTIGDSVMAEFPGPVFAVRAAGELQRRLLSLNQKLSEHDRIQLRIGINTGQGFRHDRDVYGDAVNIAARITKHTGPAQILISRSVRDAIMQETDLRCTWLGKKTLAGKADAEDVYELIWTDAPSYNELRQNMTAALMRGDLVSPGLSADDLIHPKPASAAPSLGFAAGMAAAASPLPAAFQGAAAAAASPASPTSIDDRYELLQELGAGGMGRVYKARERETGELVALKVLKPEISTDPAVMERFRNELRITRRITHKNVCRMYDLHRQGSTAYLSMEFVDGESLRAVLDRFGRLALPKGLAIAREICSGLREAHAQGVVHRDLKPENVMLDRAGNVKLMDFGIARTADAGVTMTGMVIGTPAYMAPEQAEGKPIDVRTDIYALGLLIYEILTGSCAFRGDTPVQIVLKQVQQDPIPPREIEPSLPPQVEETILKCIEKDPARRFQTIEELDTRLAAFIESSAAVSAATRARMRPLTEAPPIRKISRVAVIAASCLVIAGGLFFFGRRHPPPKPVTVLSSTQPASPPPAASVPTNVPPGSVNSTTAVGNEAKSSSVQPKESTRESKAHQSRAAVSKTIPAATLPKDKGRTQPVQSAEASRPPFQLAQPEQPDTSSRPAASDIEAYQKSLSAVERALSNQNPLYALNLVADMKTKYPQHPELAAKEQEIRRGVPTFNVVHRHLVTAQKYTCSGVLMVSPRSYRYDCVTTQDPSGRCDHFLVRADTIQDVKMLDDRSVYITVNAGANEFLGAPGDIRRISDLLKASKQGK